MLIFKIILSIFILNLNIFANVTAFLQKDKIELGEKAILEIKVSGENVKFPTIDSIAGYKIQQMANSQSIKNINGVVTKEISKTYVFIPSKSIIIPSIEVQVNGKIEKTNLIKLTIIKPDLTKPQDFYIDMEVSNKNPFVGEPVELVIKFKRKTDVNLLNIFFNPPTFENLWTKSIKDEKSYRKDNYLIQELRYIIFPQKAGELIITPATIQVVTSSRSNDMFGYFMSKNKRKSLFSNELKLDIKSIPNNIELVGKFNISVSIDKKEVNAGEPVNLILTIDGEGNLDDLSDINFKIENTTIYSDKAISDFNLVGKKYMGRYTKSFAIIGNDDFVIPKISLKYFSLKDKKIKNISTKSIKIKVNKSTKKVIEKENIKLEKKIDNKHTEKISNIENKFEKYIYFLAGLFIGFLAIFIKPLINLFKTDEKKKLSLKQRVNKIKTDKEMIQFLIPYIEVDGIKDILNKIEENIYQNKNHKIDKKVIVKLLSDIINKNITGVQNAHIR